MNAFRTFSVCVAAAGIAAAPAHAQNVNLDPSYGTLQLRSGFSDDPRLVELSSGGRNQASDTASGCRGYVATAPDVRVIYSSGSLPLMFSVASGRRYDAHDQCAERPLVLRR